MMIYEKINPNQIMYLESHFVEMIIIGIIIGIIFLTWMIYMLKTTPQIIERPYSRELPERWFKNLANIIVKNSQKKEIVSKSYELYIWKHNGFELRAYFDWQDFYDGAEVFDFPIPLSAEIHIYKLSFFKIFKKEIFFAGVDRNDYYQSEQYYYDRYIERQNAPLEIRVREKDIKMGEH